MLRTSELDYDLPESAIATVPASPRDSAKLMVIERATGRVVHTHVRDLAGFVKPGDLLVRNSTAVLPARFRGFRTDSGGKVEGLFLSDEPGGSGVRCRVLLKMRRHKPGAAITLCASSGEPSSTRLVLESRADGTSQTGDSSADAGWIVRVEDETGDPNRWLEHVGMTPLPPYILAARKRQAMDVADERDRVTYQTVFAREPEAAVARPEHGSVAAPTAGLHFTESLNRALVEQGVAIADVVLHVGLGTFKPVETEFVEQHPMHTEWCMVPRNAAKMVQDTRTRGGRVIAVGTTSARVLESFANVDDMLRREACSTNLLITPGYAWKHVDALMTNFHLPRSTLMAMVSALLPGGAGQLRELYAEALANGYRFYSFGDSMLVL